MSISISGTTSYQQSVSASYSSTTSVNVNTAQQNEAAVQTAKGSESGKTAAKNGDSVSISGKSSNVNVQALIDQNNQRIADFKNQLLAMIGKQGEAAAKASTNTGKLQAGNGYAEIFGFDENGDFDISNRIIVSVTPEESAAAAKSLEGDGEWSVNSVATRIMDMAQAFAGNDPEKLESMRAAVQEGFRQAGFDPDHREKSIMPEITGQTYDEIMSRFDKLTGKASMTGSVADEVKAQASAAGIASAHQNGSSASHRSRIDIQA